MNKRALGWTLFAAPAAALFLPAIIPRACLDSLPPCLFRSLTGHLCLSCGATRAVWLISRGKLAESLSMNLFVLPGIIFLLYASAALLVNSYSGRSVLPETRFRPWFFWVLLAAAVIFVIFRNIPFFPSIMLAPAG